MHQNILPFVHISFVQVKSLTKLKPKRRRSLALHVFSRHNWSGIFHATSGRRGIANCVFFVRTCVIGDPLVSRAGAELPDWSSESGENSDFHTFCLTCALERKSCAVCELA